MINNSIEHDSIKNKEKTLKKDLNLIKDNQILSIKNLSVEFTISKNKFLKVVRNIDLSIQKSQIVGLVGESGSGKSVTSLALINANQNCKVEWDEFYIDEMNIQSTSKKTDWNNIRGLKIGYIPQDPHSSLNPSVKIGKQLLVSLQRNIKFSKFTKEQKYEHIFRILKKCGLENPKEIINMYPHTLSGGMKQRVVIAMIVLFEPSLIIADEPTTALDPLVQSSVLALFEKIRTDLGISILIISHNIAMIAKFCDYVYVMYAGKIVEKAPKKELFTNPKHPYTWALISSILNDKSQQLYSINGIPPDMNNLPIGDAFAPRNEYALDIDFIEEPPFFKVNDSHYAATWLLDDRSPKVILKRELIDKLNKFKEVLSD